MKKSYYTNPLLGNEMLPVDIVLAPGWWHHNAGISFDREFFFHPFHRVEEEQKMEKILHDKYHSRNALPAGG